jgi:hypothetical protein
LIGARADGRINVPGNRLELNAKIGVALGAPVLMVLDVQGEETDVEDLLNKALVAKNGLEEQRAEVLGVIINKARCRPVFHVPGHLPSADPFWVPSAIAST